MFELLHRDAMGRIGALEMGKTEVETPLIMPVVNPKNQEIPPAEIRKMGFQAVITNSYIIYRDAALREKALSNGLHKLLGFDGPIMTDSGSYQLYSYGSVEVGADEIVEFQSRIGSDMGVILDIPTPPDAKRELAEKDLMETLNRAKAALAVRGEMSLAGTVQGSTHLDLREKAAKELGTLDLDLYAIGGVVPLMENYRFADLARVVLHAKKHIPPNKPVHLFGCGHPMVFAFAVALGCDVFDSAAYALYAENDRYITAEGTMRLDELQEFPCSCAVCSENEPEEVRALEVEDKIKLLARHNLAATLQEMKRVKQAIRDGSLWELVQIRSRGHPNLLEGLFVALGYELLEEYDPVTKASAFFYSGGESLLRPEVRRHVKRLERIESKAKKLVLMREPDSSYPARLEASSGEEYHVCIVSPVFGVIPTELREVYPLSQCVHPGRIDGDQVNFMRAWVGKYSRGFDEVYVDEGLASIGLEIKGERFKDASVFGRGSDEVKLKAMADYQFGGGAGEALIRGDIAVERARNGRIRRIYSKGVLLATIRASDGFIIPTEAGAERLLELPPPMSRVVMHGDASEFIREGKSAFAGFVVNADPEIRPHQEVLLVGEDDEFLAAGKALLSGKEMLAFRRGVAVKVRHHVEIAVR